MFFGGMCAALAFTGAAFGAAPAVRMIDDPIYTRPAKLVDIGTGKGTPTAVLDAGMGDSTVSWALVQPELSKTTRVCSFDRAGLGFSDVSKPDQGHAGVRQMRRRYKGSEVQPGDQ
jgi:hypothetical protein